MGASLAHGLLKSNNSSYKVTVSNPSSAPLDRLAEMGAKVTHNNVECSRAGNIVVIAVKPWLVEQVINEIKYSLDYEHQTVAVIAASVKGDQLMEWLDRDGKHPSIVLCMPNTAMSVSKSMTFLVAVGSQTESKSVEEVTAMFDKVGSTMLIDEDHLPAATALASCGIAFAMRYVRAASEGGVELGFKAHIAMEMIVKTIEGACELLKAPGTHPESEIDKVTTPGGITIKGLNEMERAGFSSSVIRGLKACVNK